MSCHIISLPNEYPYKTLDRPCTYDNWRTTQSVIFRDNIIQNETLKRIDLEKIIVQEMAEMVAAEDKAHDYNDRIKNADHKTWQEKNVFNILIKDEEKKAHDIM